MNEYLLELHAQAFYANDSDKSKIEAAKEVTVKFVTEIVKFLDSVQFLELTDVDTVEDIINGFITCNKNKKDEAKAIKDGENTTNGSN